MLCFPYAGGSASIYYEWSKLMPNEVEVIGIELPGRGKRFTEECNSQLDLLVSELSEAIINNIEPPFLFFGHSLGAVVSYEVARKLRKLHYPLPVLLIISGRAAPHLEVEREKIDNMSDFEFKQLLKRVNGIPEQAFQNNELMKLVLPIIRADFILSSSYVHQKEAPLPCSIVMFSGENDHGISIEHIRAWEEHTSCNFSYYIFEGDHFFIRKRTSQIINVISSIIKPYILKIR
jgi:surfactin synthase thioesterase subunit